MSDKSNPSSNPPPQTPAPNRPALSQPPPPVIQSRTTPVPLFPTLATPKPLPHTRTQPLPAFPPLPALDEEFKEFDSYTVIDIPATTTPSPPIATTSTITSAPPGLTPTIATIHSHITNTSSTNESTEPSPVLNTASIELLQRQVQLQQQQYDQQNLYLQQQVEQMKQALEATQQRNSQLEYQQSYYLNSHVPISNQQATNLSKIISQPEKFSGNTTTLDTWIFSMQNYLMLANVPPQLHVQIAGTYLTGAAATWFAYLAASERETLHSFASLAQLITIYFCPLDQAADARKKLATIKQTGSVSSFNNIFNATVQRLPAMVMEEKIETYRRKLVHELQVHLALTEYTNLIDIMKAAIRIETLLQSRLDTKPRSSFPPAQAQRRTPWNSTPQNNQTVAVHHIQTEEQPGSDDENSVGGTDPEFAINYTGTGTSNGNRLSKLTPAARQHCIDNRLCFRCRKPGHSSRNCTSNKSGNKTNYVPPTQPSKPSFQ